MLINVFILLKRQNHLDALLHHMPYVFNCSLKQKYLAVNNILFPIASWEIPTRKNAFDRKIKLPLLKTLYNMLKWMHSWNNITNFTLPTQLATPYRQKVLFWCLEHKRSHDVIFQLIIDHISLSKPVCYQSAGPRCAFGSASDSNSGDPKFYTRSSHFILVFRGYWFLLFRWGKNGRSC